MINQKITGKNNHLVIYYRLLSKSWNLENINQKQIKLLIREEMIYRKKKGLVECLTQG